jgi:endothelin-converting enzyme/putative endopeptidase
MIHGKARALAVAVLCLVAGSASAQSTPGFSAADMDRSADACGDFYQFACGGWRTRNPVPDDQSRWGRFNELAERNRETLRRILEKAMEGGGSRDAVDQKIGDHYAACMNEKHIEALGIAPARAALARAEGLRARDELPGLVAALHRQGVPVLFGFGSVQDFKDATSQIAVASAGGLGLPDRDYYLKDDPKSAELRTKYRAHVARMFELAGDKPATAAQRAQAVMDVETALARASLDRVARRDPANIYHRMTKEELAALTPAFAWDRYLTGIAAPAFASLNVTEPEFYKAVETLVQGRDVGAWRSYLRWHVLHASADLLPPAFVQENFAFYGRTLNGAPRLRPRWKRCVDLADQDLGEALGQRFVQQTFGEDGRARMARMVSALEAALARDIRELDWMGEVTKKEAQAKLEAIANKVGYPEKWRDYGPLVIRRDDAWGNAARAAAFEFARDLAKIGKPVDRREWRMSPPTVNAYYSPLMNDINFPAGILQPPFFDRAMDDAVNFGAIGAVIGHELTHGFDDQGRKFDRAGNLRDWWTPEDGKKFEERAACIADQYGGYTAVDDLKLNGRLTLGENTADNGGVRIALMALQDTLSDASPPPPIDGFTPEQRVFLGWAQIWCQNERPENARMRALTDPHSPGRYRVNGVVSNMPEFVKAFSCPAGSAMVREKPCRVW